MPNRPTSAYGGWPFSSLGATTTELGVIPGHHGGMGFYPLSEFIHQSVVAYRCHSSRHIQNSASGGLLST